MKEVFKLIWQCNWKGLLLKLFYTLCSSLLPLIGLYVLKLLVDGVTASVGIGVGEAGLQGLPTSLLYSLLAFCAITLLNRWVSVLNNVNNDVLTQQLTDYINNLIQNQSIRLDLAYYDNPRFYDVFHRAQQEAAFRPIRILENFVSLTGAIVSLVGVAVMMLFASWQVITVMVIAVLPTFVVRLYKSRRIYRFRRETTQKQRRAAYYGQLLTDRIYAKEVRAFGLADYFRHQYVSIRTELVRQLLRISRRLALCDSVTSVIEVLAMAVAMLCMIRPVISGAMTIGTFVMLFEAFRRGQGSLSSMVNGVSGLYEHKLFISNLFEFLSLKPDIVSPDNPLPFPERVEEVCFEDVTFVYPDMRQPVLSHYTLLARRGEITTVTGENGFGKTTLLKLLLRLYDPQGGTVRINGIDIRSFDVAQLRHNVSVIFQDYVQFHFSLRDNVVFGDINNADDARRLINAIEMADAESIVSKLDNGLDSQLGRQFDQGEELSMGQWQRVALARQLYSQAPIFFFDEPMAWMDASARSRFRQTVEKLSRDHIVIMVRHSEE